MKEVGFMKKATGVIAAAVAVLTVMPASEVQAQTSNTIFPAGWDRSVRDRMFMRLGAISVNTKTSSSDATDLTGPVLKRSDFEAIRQWLIDNPTVTSLPGIICTGNSLTTGCPATPNSGLTRSEWTLVVNAVLDNDIPETNVGGAGLGTPPGIKAKTGDASTVALSLGYWLDEERTWSLEAFLLAKPLEMKVYGGGMSPASATSDAGDAVPGPNGLNGKHILTTKMLPPLAVLSRHFGSKDSLLRPFVGVGATYAVIYDAKTTGFYDEYVGGKTTVNVKNAWGVGPFIGLTSQLNDSFHVNFQLGMIELKTEALLTTRNTRLTNASNVGADFSPAFVGAYEIGYNYATGSRRTNQGITGLLSDFALYAQNKSDFGTFTRKQSQKIQTTIFNVSLGYSF